MRFQDVHSLSYLSLKHHLDRNMFGKLGYFACALHTSTYANTHTHKHGRIDLHIHIHMYTYTDVSICKYLYIQT